MYNWLINLKCASVIKFTSLKFWISRVNLRYMIGWILTYYNIANFEREIQTFKIEILTLTQEKFFFIHSVII